ncbi:MAG: ElyC/SanA/YdcF family protein [Bacteroidales bacterium]
MARKRRNILRRCISTLTRVLIALLLLPLLLLFISNQVIRIASDGYLYDSTELIPYNRVGLVLGTSHRVRGGGPNPYFHNRMEAAARLYQSGKVSYLLVSGDNRTQWYNEPQQMRQELMKLGVPDSIIYLDFSGLRTFDSVIRCHKVFGQERFTVISQRFHNQRAVYIARQYGLEAVAYNASDVDGIGGSNIMFREWFAKTNVFLDMILKKQPRFLGEQIEIGNKVPD